MELDYTKTRIVFKKEFSSLDKFVIDFTSVLNKLGAEYVLVSGYVAILFGRSRSSEDVDIFIGKLDFTKFKRLWNGLYDDFECLNTNNPREAYERYLLNNLALRFSRKGSFIPNIEMKFPKIEIDFWTLAEKKEVLLNGYKLFVSPLELQIPFKLYLGSEKDIEDAKHLYKLFKDKLNLELLQKFNRKFKVEEVFDKYLR